MIYGLQRQVASLLERTRVLEEENDKLMTGMKAREEEVRVFAIVIVDGTTPELPALA